GQQSSTTRKQIEKYESRVDSSGQRSSATQ
ncbi:unnamed protein product, partial [Rotaria sordida]